LLLVLVLILIGASTGRSDGIESGSQVEPELILVPITTTTVAPETTVATTTTTTAPALADERREPIAQRRTVKVAEVTVPEMDDRVRCPDMWPVIATVWPAEHRAHADYIAFKESSCRPDVVRANVDFGLYQINQVHHDWLERDWGITRDDLLDPMVNATAAWLLFQIAEDMYGCGFQPWYMSVDYESMCA